MDFYDLFSKALKDSGLGNTEFAKLAGASKQHVTDMLKRRRTPPMKKIKRWADALGLAENSAFRADFIWHAQLAHSPAAVRDMVASMEQEIARLGGSMPRFSGLSDPDDSDARISAALEPNEHSDVLHPTYPPRATDLSGAPRHGK